MTKRELENVKSWAEFPVILFQVLFFLFGIISGYNFGNADAIGGIIFVALALLTLLPINFCYTARDMLTEYEAIPPEEDKQIAYDEENNDMGYDEARSLLQELSKEDGHGNPLFKSINDKGNRYKEALAVAIKRLEGN